MSRKSQVVGAAFESWVDGQHFMAGQLGILAHVEHNQATARVLDGRLTYAAPGVADYTGILQGGLYLAAEAKSTDDPRLYKSAVSPKQQAHLNSVVLAGGLAILLVEFRSKVHPFFRRYALRWADAPWAKARTADSIEPEALQKWLLTPGSCYLKRWHPGSEHRYLIGSVGQRSYARE